MNQHDLVGVLSLILTRPGQKRGLTWFWAVGLVAMLSGCGRSVSIQVLEPAKVTQAEQIRQIAVMPLEQDRIGLTERLETALAQSRVDGARYFTLVNRRDQEQVLAEQRFQHSGLLASDKLVELGELLGASGLVSGRINQAESDDERYYEERIRCRDKKCEQTYLARVWCTARHMSLSASLRVTDVAKAEILHAQTYQTRREWHHCRDSANTLPTRGQGLQQLADELAQRFVRDMTPHYRSVSIELLSDPAMDYSSKQSEQLDRALAFMEAGRFDRAQTILTTLLQSTHQQSYVAAYNLGVAHEAQGDLKAAQALYQMADGRLAEPDEVVNAALIRIDLAIEKQALAQRQLQDDSAETTP
ncbi:DUF6340 family protein [Thiomicrospira sp. WB1]|uniref:DUF6340 family protein n=1 Tax=Thiomicrospira sp. WB1 TaxID=1685380 RepID=UPI000747FE72|nr:DUF6340 family protein [Thiomicrospira sp. WB1]KUJ72668.1 hypothetical protein AVO41_02385 [Thiomicrospira sp. WB1]